MAVEENTLNIHASTGMSPTNPQSISTAVEKD